MIKRLFTHIITLGLIFTMTACSNPATLSIMGTNPNAKPEWKTYEASTIENRIKDDIIHIELLTAESGTSYSSDYFRENTLILYQELVLIGAPYSAPITDVRVDGDQIVLVNKAHNQSEDPYLDGSMVSASRVASTFIEVHNFIPKSNEVKLIYEYDTPPKLIGDEPQSAIKITQSESAALPQYQYLDYESADSLIKEHRNSQECETFPRSFFNTHDLIMVQAITSADDETPPAIARVETEGDTIKVTVTRYAAVSDTPTAEDINHWCLLISTRCFRPEFAQIEVEYYAYEEHHSK